jgi:solute carrier family 25 S-adenosylmethionine transporter 26
LPSSISTLPTMSHVPTSVSVPASLSSPPVTVSSSAAVSTAPTASTALLAGAFAGLSVDVVLFPLDTIKTRMQSSAGFRASGGFRYVYAGIASAAVGSAPSAAIFFVSYEQVKRVMQQHVVTDHRYDPLVHCTAAAVGELAACLIRVPTDNIKQKRQARLFSSTSATIRAIVSTSGYGGFYAGYLSTIMREIPFSLIQFPLYEWGRKRLALYSGRPCSPWECALLGSLSGSVAAALTTPMDVVKTRLMLARADEAEAAAGVLAVLRSVHAEGGIRRLESARECSGSDWEAPSSWADTKRPSDSSSRNRRM